MDSVHQITIKHFVICAIRYTQACGLKRYFEMKRNLTTIIIPEWWSGYNGASLLICRQLEVPVYWYSVKLKLASISTLIMEFQ